MSNAVPLFAGTPDDPATMIATYRDVRRVTEGICTPLATEDYVIQAMPNASPAKWHLGHVSWFFETFILQALMPGYQPLNPTYRHLFNSYYEGAGPQFNRSHRGHLSRPTVAEVYEYRSHIDESMLALVETTAPKELAVLSSLNTLGLNHEQQHQELLLTDIKYNLSVNPLRPAYQAMELPRGTATPRLRWAQFEGGVHWIGHDGNSFAFDNEWPRHQSYIRPFSLASRLVTNSEYLEFIEAGGYNRPDLWLSEGWEVVLKRQWTAPLYWERVNGVWRVQTLSGMQPLDEQGPVAHVSYYEADAYARWSGKRLPSEQEWELAAKSEPIRGNLLESGIYHPLPAPDDDSQLQQLFGDLWEWTQSPYVPYPGYRPLEGTLGEYNGKFMVNQMVLRGGSCATPATHIRATYRNFFPPDTRWQFSGIRLADDA